MQEVKNPYLYAFFSISNNETPLENVFYNIQYPEILQAMMSSVVLVTGIIGIKMAKIIRTWD